MRVGRLFGIICLCQAMLFVRAQHGAAGGPTDYDRRWAVVDSLMQRAGRPASALAEVNRIYAAARQERNSGQEIKALIYKVTIGEKVSDNDSTAIREMERSAGEAAQPSRSILESVLARQYWTYLQGHRWQLYNRTASVVRSNADFSTWSVDDFHRHIRELFLASLRDEELLKHSLLKDWAPILLKGNTPLLRPTLFDLLAHEALDYFKSSETDINQPEQIFEMDDPAAFADASVFTGHVFATTDSSSPHYQALLLYQRLLRFHLTGEQKDALIDVDIDRLDFAKNYSVVEDKEEQYLRRLTQLTDRWGDKPAAAKAWYLEAKYYSDFAKTSGGRPDSAGFDGNVRAVAICKQVLNEPDSSEGRMNCHELLDEIVAPSIGFEVEQFNVTGKPFRCLVNWANVNRLYFRLEKIDSLYKNMTMRQNGDDWQEWLRAPVYRQFTQDLPAASDYRLHSAEIPIGSLPPGTYVLLGSTDPGWDRRNGFMAGQVLFVSSMAYVREDRDYFLVNRETGQPVSDARAQVWEKVWNNVKGVWKVLSRETLHTDQQGHFQLARFENYGQRFLELQRPGEDIFLSDLSIPYPLQSRWNNLTADKSVYEKGNATIYFFLDRSIYRPGQAVYFKAITFTRDYDTRQMKPLAGRHAKVVLTNANSERVDSLDVVTDEFGAYHGVFRLPDHGLNGRFGINDNFGQMFTQSFSVEEYKRPRFYVSFDRLKGSYRVGDSIRIHGSAKAYSGNNLDGATVKYRITRRARYPGYSFYAWRRLRSQSGQEIAHGELKTDANGEFRIAFVARPDRSIPITADPHFDYEISADVTDINGETRSGSADIAAGYSVLNLGIQFGQDEAIPADSLRFIHAEVTNLSGEPVAAAVHLAAYPLAAPVRLIRNRLWETAPDRSVMNEAAFLDSFPHDPYRDELNKEKWARGAAAWEGMDSTGGHPPALQLKPGWWVIEATATDSFGQPVKDTRYVQLYDNGTGGPVNPEYLWGGDAGTTTIVEPGGVARVQTGSSARDVHVIREIAEPDKAAGVWRRQDEQPEVPTFQHFMVSGGRKNTEWKITEAERGGFAVADVFVKDNRVYVHRAVVQVPWDNKKLDIRYSSFRDKTVPGSAEKWAVEINGWRGDRVAAQVLAAMYDASLDQFESHSWVAPNPYPGIGYNYLWRNIDDFGVQRSNSPMRTELGFVRPLKVYDRLISVGLPGRFGWDMNGDIAPFRGNHYKLAAPGVAPAMSLRYDAIIERNLVKYNFAKAGVGEAAERVAEPPAPSAPPPVQVRTNFQETAFFFPDLRTDSLGAVSFSFTMPESLTQWKWMTLAHTSDLAFGYSEKTIITQKQLMVQPNMPRFLREGDKINLSVKVVNLTDSEMTGQMGLALTDPTTGEPADGWFVNRQPNQYFTVPARGSAVVEFPLDIPYQYNRPLSYRVVAQAGVYSDGEEAVLPVVSNRMLVTETLPLNMPGDGVRSFKFEKLLASGSSETLNHHALTVEFTANPAWYAVQALPYLMEYPYECAEQTFDRLYANALASDIVSRSPRIAQVFERWRTVDTSALLSNLEKNQELKSVLLEETPWVLEGKTETQQKKNIALLFDLVRVSSQLASTVDRLSELQAQDGGFPWFKGGPDDRYVTQYILTGLGRLLRLQSLSSPWLLQKVKNMVATALVFADQKIKEDYERDLKVEGGIHQIEPFAAQYLYMRSMFNDYGIPGPVFPAVNFYRKVAQREWVKASKYTQGMVALALFRTGDVQTARNILASLRETAIRNEDLGMFWKGMEGGYYWYEAPIETESLLIGTFREIRADTAADRQMKTWLLRQKQTHHWATTKATADAVYALLMGGSDWLDQGRSVTVQLGEKTVEWPASSGASAGEAGTGYDKKIFDAPFINPSMGNIKVSMSSAHGGGSPAWGAVYWQYFDQLDRITPPEGGKAPLRVEKRLFVQRNTDRGPVLDTIPDNGTVHVGDRVVVRLVLRTDRDLEYVHLKDMRGACFEPVNVLSGYQWQGGLGYYESTKDVSTEFFFSFVRRGTYVFEYPLTVGQTGEFSNGIASVECMYAPEFASHTEGIRVNVEGGQ
ncbi:MAG TPA: alpha-2-macroglobulin family protein [Puia sp.]|nr:alpha-2-macroglobulin family protein [Puia sp.]